MKITLSRIIKGNEVCNNLWQEARSQADNPQEYNALMDRLTGYTEKLRELVFEVNMNGYQECCFGKCKWNENYICFGCTKEG